MDNQKTRRREPSVAGKVSSLRKEKQNRRRPSIHRDSPRDEPAEDFPTQCVKWIFDALADLFKMRYPSESEVKATSLKLINDPVGILKWFFAASFSYGTDQELPKGPHDLPWELFPVSRIRLFWRSFLRQLRSKMRSDDMNQRRRALSKLTTVLNLKKGAPVVPESFIENSLEKHFSSLTVHPPPGFVEPEADLDFGIFESIKEVVTEVFGRARFKEEDISPHMFPSIRGHYGHGRDKGGALLPILNSFERKDSDLFRMDYHPKLGVVESRGEFQTNGRKVVYGRNAKGAAVAEPLKVRVVTTGDPYAYFLCKPLQSFLWRTLKSHPTFKLVGNPVNADILYERLNNPGFGDLFLSGDYKAATDNLKSRFSKYAWDTICKVSKIPEYWRRLGAVSLIGHVLESPKTKEKRLQGNGQFMGSPMSFPILCIINAALLSLAYKSADWSLDCADYETVLTRKGEWAKKVGRLDELQRKVRNLEEDDELSTYLFYKRIRKAPGIKDFPVLINGDDVIARGDSKLVSAWRSLCARFGLEESVGKTYVDPRFFQINSASFLVKKDGSFEQVNYVNLSLCNLRAAKGNEERHFSCIGALSRQFIQPTPCWSEKFLYDLFMKRHRKGLLLRAPAWISWSISEDLGGLGIKLHSREVTHRQIQLATKLATTDMGLSLGPKADLPKIVSRAMQKIPSVEVFGEEDDWAMQQELVNLAPALNHFIAQEDWSDSWTKAERRMFFGEGRQEERSRKRWWRAWNSSKDVPYHLLLEEDKLFCGGPKKRVYLASALDVFRRITPLRPGDLIRDFCLQAQLSKVPGLMSHFN